MSTLENNNTEAVRFETGVRYDILTPEFLHLLAKIADYGAKKYGDFNWKKSSYPYKSSLFSWS